MADNNPFGGPSSPVSSPFGGPSSGGAEQAPVGTRRKDQPGYVFYPTGHVVRDSDKKVWDPSTQDWYYMTEHGMSPEKGKSVVPSGDDTRLDTLNLLRSVGSPVIGQRPTTPAGPSLTPEQQMLQKIGGYVPENQPSLSALSSRQARAMPYQQPLEGQMGQEARTQDYERKYGKVPYWLNTALQFPLGMVEWQTPMLPYQAIKMAPTGVRAAGELVGKVGLKDLGQKIRNEADVMENYVGPSPAMEQLESRDLGGRALRMAGMFLGGAVGKPTGPQAILGQTAGKAMPAAFAAQAGAQTYEGAKAEGASTRAALTKGAAASAITGLGMKYAPRMGGNAKSVPGAYARMGAVAAGGGLGQTVVENGIGKLLYHSQAGWLDGAADNTMFWALAAGHGVKHQVERAKIYREAKAHPEGLKGYMADKAIESNTLMDKAFTGENDADGKPVLDMGRLSPDERTALDKNQYKLAVVADYDAGGKKPKKALSLQQRAEAIAQREAEAKAAEETASVREREALAKQRPEIEALTESIPTEGVERATFPEVKPEEAGAYKSREIPADVQEALLAKAQEGKGATIKMPWETEGMAPGEEHARSVVDEAARRRQEAGLEIAEAIRQPNREQRLTTLQRGMEETPDMGAKADRATMLQSQVDTPFEPVGNTKEGIRQLKAREGTRKELANLNAELAGRTEADRRAFVADSIDQSIQDYQAQYEMSHSQRVKGEIDRLQEEKRATLAGETRPEVKPQKISVVEPPPAREMPITEARTGQERRIATEPTDVERRSIERRAEIKKAIGEELPVEHMTPEQLAEEVKKLRSDRMLDEKVPGMANGKAFDAAYEEGNPVASLDVKGLKATNKYGQHVGDEFLIHVFSELNRVSKEEGVFAAHRSGDEALLTHTDSAKLDRVIEQTNKNLQDRPFTFTDSATGETKQFKGELHYGTAESPEAADRAMAAAKVERAKADLQLQNAGRQALESATAPGREPVPEPGISYLNSGLNIQHAIADVLGMKRGSTWSEMAPVAMEKIGKLGASVRETAVKIVNTFKGITREAADILAKSLHESFSGSRESQMGAVGKEVSHEVKAARDQQRAEREAIKASDMTKEERREAYKSITKMDALLRNGQAPADTAEATEMANVSASKTVPKADREAAVLKLHEGLKAGVQPQFSDLLIKPDGSYRMGPVLNYIHAMLVGDGIKTESGAQAILRPAIEYDPQKGVEAVRRDLNWAERLWGKLGSSSHTYTGTMSLGVEGERGNRTIGAMDPKNMPMTDIHLGNMAKFTNTINVSNNLIDTLTKYRIPNNHFRLVKELKKTGDYWSKAHKAYNDALDAYEHNLSPTTKAALDSALKTLNMADKVMDDNLLEVYADPSYGDARVMAWADATRGGKEAPEWLDKLTSQSEKAAAKEIVAQMEEIKRAMVEAGIPVREDFGVPHTIKNWLKGDLSRPFDREGNKINAESLEFKHRGERSVMTMPDAYGMVEDYIPHAMGLIAKRNVSNKWEYLVNEIRPAHEALAKQIEKDINDYKNGPGGLVPWMDKINSWFANYLVGYRTATATKHLAKYPLELANASPVKSAMGWIDFQRAARKDPELRTLMKEMTKIAKGPRYNPLPDIGASEDWSGRAKTVSEKIAMSSHYPMQAVEGALRSNTFRMDILGNIKKGMEPREAVADAVFRSLIVNFQGSDKPVIMRSSVGRSIFFLQQTVWKIMEVNARAFTDAARGVKRGGETLFTGEKLSGEEKARYAQSARQIAALAAMYYLGEKTNTKVFDWIFETPSIIKALIGKPMMDLVKYAIHKYRGEKAEWHYDPTEELMSGISATQAFQMVEKASKDYGFGSEGFFIAIAPLSAQDIGLRPSKYQEKIMGTGTEGLIRRVTGQPKAKEEKEAKEKMQEKNRRLREKKSEKLVRRIRPLSDFVPSPKIEQPSSSPFGGASQPVNSPFGSASSQE